MKNIIAWIKTNPISVASFLTMLVATGVIAYFLLVANPALRERAAEQPTKDLNDIKRFASQSVEVPPKNADDPPERHSGVTINDHFLQVISTIYGDLNRESDEISARALEINEPGHPPLLPGLFPDVPTGERFRAQTVYVTALDGLLGGPQKAEAVAQSTGLQIPYLNAGLPLTREALQRQVDEAAAAMRRISSEVLTEDQMKSQQAEQSRELMNALLIHAKTLNIYAQPNLGNPRQPFPDFPLQVASLGASPNSPQPAAIWEGQLELWILQDIVRAIGIANDVQNLKNYGTDASGEPINSSVLNAPIKRLIRAEVLPGYVGLHTLGGTNLVADTQGTTGGVKTPGQAGYGPPAGGKMTDGSRDVPIADNYVFSPTGRSTNQVYDTRHVRLIMHADYQRLPEFFNVLAQVNLMTVVNMRIKQIDEYELLKQQYMYGQGDVVEVDMIIETLWLREWTADMMPETVKQYVGLVAPPADATGGAGGFNGDPGFGQGYGQNYSDPGYGGGQNYGGPGQNPEY